MLGVANDGGFAFAVICWEDVTLGKNFELYIRSVNFDKFEHFSEKFTSFTKWTVWGAYKMYKKILWINTLKKELILI